MVLYSQHMYLLLCSNYHFHVQYNTTYQGDLLTILNFSLVAFYVGSILSWFWIAHLKLNLKNKSGDILCESRYYFSLWNPCAYLSTTPSRFNNFNVMRTVSFSAAMLLAYKCWCIIRHSICELLVNNSLEIKPSAISMSVDVFFLLIP